MSTQPNTPTPLDLDAIRARLAGANGPEFWRSLDEVAQTPAFQAYVDHEFTEGTSEWTNPVSRRRLLELLGASLGLAGLTACTKQPPEKIVPYVTPPEDVIPGKPLFFATSIPTSGYANGVIVESHMGRPTKIEGNPEHPASLGATDVYTQAATLGLYDPDRSQATLREGRNSSWQRFEEALKHLREELLANKGAGFRLLTETVTSPTLGAWIKTFLTTFPEAKWYQYETVSRDAALAGTRLAFGESANAVYNLEAADVIVSLDANFLIAGPGAVRYARQFAAKRNGAGGVMNRLYVVEPHPTPTGSSADHRLAMSAAEIENFARALGAAVGAAVPAATTKAEKWLKAVAKDLSDHRGTSVVIPGEQQSAAVHAIAAAINVALGNVGKTVTYTEPVEASPVDQTASLKQLADDLNGGHVSTLLVAGGNPMYAAPADLKFGEAFRKAKVRIHLGEYEDETSAVCHWHVPMAHPLESWGDLRAFDGTVSVQQPLIAPLYEGRQLIELLAVLLEKGGRSIHDLVKENWATLTPEAFRKAIHDGVVPATASAARTVAVSPGLSAALASSKRSVSGTEIIFQPCPNVYDGRFANNAWLQELPRPLTKVVWENAVHMSPRMAQSKGFANGDVAELRAEGRSVKGPVWITPGHADDCVTVHIGYGRTRGGKIANGVGFNANLIRSSASPWSASGEIRRTGESSHLTVTQEHHSMIGRNLVREGTLEEFKKTPDFAVEEEKGKHILSLYPGFEYKGYSWGLSVDLSACTGCNACTIACQAENNIPVVGKDQVERGREMHWMRIDRYFEGSLDDPSIHHQPVMCMHCDNAPCEGVCPVAATSHSEEGLNQMTYNRCVGTRYCSNNCPYKVRRFNFFLYNDWDTQSLHSLRNPNVTVRSRGVMEKCTYCVQRINAARIEAEKESRQIRDGEVITACQAVCPTQAITFGNMNDPNSKIAKAKKDPRNYGLLTDINTAPRTTYLARLRNPNPELEKA